jgi:DNA primase catalytic subunit
MQSEDYKKTVDAKNDKTRKELNILEDMWENDRDIMTSEEKDLRFKLQRTISARESRLNKKQDETLYVEIIKKQFADVKRTLSSLKKGSAEFKVISTLYHSLQANLQVYDTLPKQLCDELEF